MTCVVAPLWYGACKKGPDDGALRLAELFEKESHSEICKVSVPADVSGDDDRMPYFNAIDKVNRKIYELVHSTLSSGGKVITIGGDHAVSWGSIAGVLEFNPEVGVIYIDAHGDCNISERSSTHHIHGMHMAYLMGFGASKYVGRYTDKLLPVGNMLYVGARSLDPYERELVNDHHISMLTSDFVNSDLDKTLAAVGDFISRFNQIHISLDIDVLDPSIAPETGVPEVDGITEEALHKILNLVLNENKTKSIDFVEFNPLYDKEGRTDMVAQRLVKLLSRL